MASVKDIGGRVNAEFVIGRPVVREATGREGILFCPFLLASTLTKAALVR